MLGTSCSHHYNWWLFVLVTLRRCPRGSVGMAALLHRWQTTGGGSIPRWSASKPQVVIRRKAKGAAPTKKKCVGCVAFRLRFCFVLVFCFVSLQFALIRGSIRISDREKCISLRQLQFKVLARQQPPTFLLLRVQSRWNFTNAIR